MKNSILFRAAIFLLATLLCICTSVAAQEPVVAVTGGSVRGRMVKDGGALFRGIPFAQPPVGALRWREPMPVTPWTSVRDAAGFGGECAQNPMWGHPKVVNEDCLYLNVWTPALPPTPLRPVMVWIHGGGNVNGSGRENGEGLSRHGVVLVNFNYRLAVFGFFAHPALTAESPRHASGNYGLMDQIAALKWVQENIKKFGGDPTNVTIFGESAGAMDVNLLMTSPLAKGLFHRVIAESGSVLLDNGAAPLKTAEQRGEKLAELAKAPTGAATIPALRDMPVEQLLEAFGKYAGPGGVPPGLGVDVDGWVLPQSPAEVFASGKQLSSDLIIGMNAREFGGPPNAADVKKSIETNYNTLAARALPLYGITTAPDGKVAQSSPDALYGDAGAQWMTDITFRCPAVVVAQWSSAAKQPTYLYQFNRGVPGHPEVGAAHASEVSYVFGTFGKFNGMQIEYDAADYAISKAMQEYWTNFAKTGNPDSAILPAWPKYQPDTGQYLEFTDRGAVAGTNLRRAQCDLFTEALKQQAGKTSTSTH